MKAIFNSDLLYSTYLVKGRLSRSVEALFVKYAEAGITVVIPETALLEYNNKQDEFVQREIKSLDNAYSLLDSLKIHYERVDPATVIKRPDLIDLIKKLGVKVQIEEPGLDDFKEAHRRACLHESPHPPETKSDEMRDLIIWMIALRLSTQEGGAFLLSRDEVHSHDRGDIEATAANLVRFESIEAALDHFERMETPAANLMKSLLEPVWENLSAAGLPVAIPMSLLAVSDATFIQGKGEWPTFAHSALIAETNNGEKLKAILDIEVADNKIVRLSLTDISIDNHQWGDGVLNIEPNTPLPTTRDDYEERLSALKETVDG